MLPPFCAAVLDSLTIDLFASMHDQAVNKTSSSSNACASLAHLHYSSRAQTYDLDKCHKHFFLLFHFEKPSQTKVQL